MDRRVLLVILDGWGIAPAGPGNAISLADTPNFNYYWSKYPHMTLSASGEKVGLPKGQMGNSEVGHLNIGAGRIVRQDLPRISQAITDKSFFENNVFKNAFAYVKKENRPLHLMGLLSDGGVHSHQDHLFALLAMAKEADVKKVFVHVFTDGRDVGPKTALKYIKNLEEKIAEYKIGEIATITGRFYAMDRDKRWERIAKAYNGLVCGEGEPSSDLSKTINDLYQEGITDEFIEPIVLTEEGKIKDGDALIFFNLRSDRPRELSEAFVKLNFSGFERKKVLKNLYFVTMTEYEKGLPIQGIAFPEKVVKKCLAEVLSNRDITQLHIAETEKYAHVTYFFNGGREEIFENEKRILIPSPKVKTYNLSPQMSAREITTELIKNLDQYQFTVVNYANLDMVGHTGNLEATILACESVDRCLGDLVNEAQKKGFQILITADHGNAEKMLDDENNPVTSHTTNPVPFIYLNEENAHLRDVGDPKLGNIAPTILDIMLLDKPQSMNESSLLKKK
ncbi:MAG: 2,3-bisphosphoglycerate-independent phosphoglycerate mutase [Patescibacteria group bacterium]|nr:2,3-bisphosphoglycerate-independent phosphoglycerate mutase [Patescibacteria group bacterium]